MLEDWLYLQSLARQKVHLLLLLGLLRLGLLDGLDQLNLLRLLWLWLRLRQTHQLRLELDLSYRLRLWLRERIDALNGKVRNLNLWLQWHRNQLGLRLFDDLHLLWLWWWRQRLGDYLRLRRRLNTLDKLWLR